MSGVIAEIFSQGEEVVTGQIADTNAAWLSQQLERLGLDLARHSVVGDHLDRMVDVLREIAARADLCVCSGGLGPTVDDWTTEAVSRAFARPLRLDPEALRRIEDYFTARGLPMPAVNRKQAALPQGARRLDNLWGTAPGFTLQQERCLFVFLPGVPLEMKAMFRHWVETDVVARFALAPSRRIVFRTLGMGESSLQERLRSVALPDAVRLGFRAASSAVDVKLLFPPGFPGARVDEIARSVARLLEDAAFSIDGWDGPGGSLAEVVGRLLEARHATLATIETASGGQVAWQCRGQSWLLESIVTTDGARWCRASGLEVDEASDPGRASVRMAMRLREMLGSDYALVNLGWIPLGESCSDHPPSRLAVGLAGPAGSASKVIPLTGPPERRRKQAAAFSLDLLRRDLLDRKEDGAKP